MRDEKKARPSAATEQARVRHPSHPHRITRTKIGRVLRELASNDALLRSNVARRGRRNVGRPAPR